MKLLPYSQDMFLTVSRKLLLVSTFCVLVGGVFCTKATDGATSDDPPEGTAPPVVQVDSQAMITAVSITGTEDSFTFSVTVASPDTGCEQYADWWEVTTPDSALVYRRILTHSHVDEQPFRRSGGPVKTNSTQQLIVRAHMNNLGYGQLAFVGSIATGFSADTLPLTFGMGLAKVEPLPQGCRF